MRAVKKAFKPARTESLRDRSVAVSEPTHQTEFEIQALLWSELRKLGVNVRGEVKCIFSGRAVVRFDLAVFEDGRLVGLIECKREGKQTDSEWSETRQGRRYAQFGVPVLLVRGHGDALKVIEAATRGQMWTHPP